MKKYTIYILFMVVSLSFSAHGADNDLYKDHTLEEVREISKQKTSAYQALSNPTDEQASSYANWMVMQSGTRFLCCLGGMMTMDDGKCRKMTSVEVADWISGRSKTSKKS